MRLANSTNLKLDNSLVEGKGRHFTSRFIEPGLVSYEGEGAGILKVSKEAIERFVQSMIGCPVIIKHQKVSNENVDEIRCGVVSGVNYNPEDGWYWCEGIIWDSDAISKIEQGWSVSCCYCMTESTGESGEWHNMSYDDELVNGVFEHLAIVPNPRYEEATILLNSKEGKGNMLLKLFNSKKIRNSDEEGKDMKENGIKKEILKLFKNSLDDEDAKKLSVMLDKLANSKKSNEDDEEDEKDKEDKENSCKSNESDEEDEDKKENESEDKDDEDEKDNEDEKDDEEDGKDEKENKKRKSNSKSDFDSLKRLSNASSGRVSSGYIPESARIKLGESLY